LALPVGSPWSPLLLQVSVLGWIDVVLNLCPILELDGYWAVADALDRPHLRTESYRAVRELFTGTRPSSVPMALFGLASIVAGMGLIALSVWLWAHVYTGLIVETWGSGLLGRIAVAVWLTPTLLGLVASFVGWVKGFIVTRSHNSDDPQQRETGGEKQ
jgi:hypothetical protein